MTNRTSRIDKGSLNRKSAISAKPISTTLAHFSQYFDALTESITAESCNATGNTANSVEAKMCGFKTLKTKDPAGHIDCNISTTSSSIHWRTGTLLTILSLLLGAHLGGVQSRSREGEIKPLTPQQEKEVDHFITALLQCRNMPGVAVTAVTGNRILLQRGYGVTDVSSRRPVTPDTLFPIASNTKAFTSTLLAMLLDETNGTDWDTPIKQILGSSFELYNDVLTEQISLRDLLAHRTGVPDYFLPLMAVYPENETRKKMVWRLRYHKPIYPFRSKFRYNNYMYMLAGYVAELLGKASWEELVRTRILDPLEMTSSTFLRHLENWNDLAPSYAELENGTLHPVDKILIRQAHVADPAGAILSTVRDVTKWLQLHLRRGVLPDGRPLVAAHLLEETYLEEMPSPAPMADRDLLRPTFPVDDVHLAYDMGWMTNVYRGYKRVWHSGGLTTYKSQVWFYPHLDLGLAIVCSGPPKGATSWALIHILQHLTDLLTGHSPWMNATTGCTFPEPWRKPEPSPAPPEGVSNGGMADDPLPSNVEEMTGIFRHPGFGELNFTLYPESPMSRRRMYMRMGQYLEAALLYNKTEQTFYTNLTGRYWYSPLKIPVRFTSSGLEEGIGSIDTVLMPLNSPWAEMEPFAFVRGRASQVHDRKGVQRLLCTTNQAAAPVFKMTAHSEQPLLIFGLVLIYLFIVTR